MPSRLNKLLVIVAAALAVVATGCGNKTKLSAPEAESHGRDIRYDKGNQSVLDKRRCTDPACLPEEPAIAKTNTPAPSSMPNPSFGLAAPSNVVARLISGTEIELTWDDHSSEEGGFKIERAANDDGHYAVVGEVGANVESYRDRNLALATQYAYRVLAFRRVDGVEETSDATGETTTIATSLIAPRDLVAAVAANSHVELSWTIATDAESTRIERATTSFGPFIEITSVLAPQGQFTDTTTPSPGSYFYRARSANTKEMSPYTEVIEVAIAPSVASPINLRLVKVEWELNQAAPHNASHTLAWDHSGEGVLEYDIELAYAVSGPWNKVASILPSTSNSVKIVGGIEVTSGNAYYRVVALGSGGRSYSTTLTYPIPTAASFPPMFEPAAEALSSNELVVNWTPASLPRYGQEVQIYYAEAGSGVFNSDPITAELASLARVISNLTPATGYTVKMVATQGIYFGIPVVLQSVTTPAMSTALTPVPSLTAASNSVGTVTLLWTAVTGATGYRVYWRKSDGIWQVLRTVTAPSGSPITTTHTGTSPNGLYYYRVRAFDATGDTGDSPIANAFSK